MYTFLEDLTFQDYILAKYILYLVFYRENIGESVVYLWVERIREFIQEQTKSGIVIYFVYLTEI